MINNLEEKKKILGENGLCPMPWTQFEINQNEFITCCHIQNHPIRMITKNNNNLNVDKDDLKFNDIINSSEMQELRKSMLSNTWHEGCIICKQQESLNGLSKRFRIPLPKNFLERLNRTSSDGIYDYEFKDFNAIDMHLGNLCNQKCNYCNPSNSNLLLDEHIEYFGDKDYYYSKTPSWDLDKENFLMILDNGLREIWFEGGEPLMIKTHTDILEYIIDHQISKEFTLGYTTNLLPLNLKILNYWKEFKEVKLTISMDGINDHQEYIRYNSDYKKLSENIDKLKNLIDDGFSIIVGFNVVLSIYNVFNIIDLYVHLLNDIFNYKSQIKIHTSPVRGNKKFLSINIIPEELKERVKNYWNQRIEESKNILSEEKLNLLKQYTNKNIEYLDSKKYDEIDWNNFLRYTKFLDNKRGNSFPNIDENFGKYFT